jgi:CBS domain-containing protein
MNSGTHQIADHRHTPASAHRGDLSSVTVTTLMSRPVLAIGERVVLQDALLALVTGGVRHLAVVDAEGRCVGMVTDRMLAAEWAYRPLAFARHTVAMICHDEPPMIDRDATVAAAAKVMRRCGTDAVVVADPDLRPIGVMTSGDIIALLAHARQRCSRRRLVRNVPRA